MPSTAIETFTYDEARHELAIRFAGGTTYVYSLVPAAVVKELEAAASRGAFVNARVKDRYPFRKVADAASGKPAAASLKDRLGASLAGDD